MINDLTTGYGIFIENMLNAAQMPEELCDVADTLGIGICWDFGHANISGVKQSKGLAYVGKRLKVLHVNDNFAGDDIHILPFTGNVDWRDAMHGLALSEFDGLRKNEEIIFQKLFTLGCGSFIMVI